MYPKLSDLINSLLGTSIDLPVQTYGFFIALAFILAGFLVYLELKRKEANGTIKPQKKERIIGKPASAEELILSFLVSAVVLLKLGGIIFSYDEFTADPQGYLFSWKGSWATGLAGAAIYTFYIYWQKQKKKLDPPKKVTVTVHPYQLTGNILLIAAIAGIAGAKLFDVIEHIDQLVQDPIGTLFSLSGLAFYGGLIVAAIAVAIYAEKNNIPWPVIGDTVAPALLVGYGTGRIGCQLSGDGCWGIVNNMTKPDWLSFLPDWMWAFRYPHNVIDEGVIISNCTGEHCHILAEPVFPTPFYETVIVYLFFVILWSLRKKITIPGMMFSIYLLLNGIERFFIEKIRVNIRYDLAGMKITQAEIISVIMMLLGVSGIIYFICKFRKKKQHSDNGL